MIYNQPEIVSCIRRFIENKRKEDYFQPDIGPIRGDIFRVVEQESVLLYYPLVEDANIKGCHIKKSLNGELKHFVFINTARSVQEQTWTAAHELGHVWGVDQYVVDMYDLPEEVTSEDIVNRFASEVLLPEELFKKRKNKILLQLHEDGSALDRDDFMYLVTALMDYFCSPYKAIIRRMVEMGYVATKHEIPYIKSFEENKDYYEKLLKENYFTLLEQTRKVFRIENIVEDIRKIEKDGLASEKTIAFLKEKFEIDEETRQGKTFVLGGQDE